MIFIVIYHYISFGNKNKLDDEFGNVGNFGNVGIFE
jgi:hypothetical protein